ncbi:MAG: hypothetical protein SAJ37_13960 [Oscillatoria sp. PMC 1068.18]|nr:hypothetical protein [Oscillatoria sp. PMC 1076.18]MEC4989831.1 hypothetical protein [Oscillatoria sp. PMC 1068.18]
MFNYRQASKKVFFVLNFAIASLLLWGLSLESLAQEVNSSRAEEAIGGAAENLQEGSLVPDTNSSNADNQPANTVNSVETINPGIITSPNSTDATDESGLDANVDATDESGLDANVDATDESGLDANVDATGNNL